jgi:hypothetical protein
MYYDPAFQAAAGWNSFWTFEKHFLNNYTPKSWHLRWTARKWYGGTNERKTVPALTLKELFKALHTNIAWKYLGHSGSYHNGAFLAGVSTAGLGDGWTGGPFNHYVSVDASIPSYNSGHGVGPGLVFMDTGYRASAPSIFGDGTTTGHAALVTDFLNSAIEQSGHISSGAYISDRMIVFAQRTT